MKYELAKKLKDNGFPQHGEFWWFAKSVRENGERKQLWKRIYNYKTIQTAENERFVDPTLSELIAACKLDGWFNLRYYPSSAGLKNWEAQKSWGRDDLGIFEEHGSTPEEAVANLWLALQEK